MDLILATSMTALGIYFVAVVPKKIAQAKLEGKVTAEKADQSMKSVRLGGWALIIIGPITAALHFVN